MVTRGRRSKKRGDSRVGFSVATPPVVASVDGGVSRQPWDVQWQHLALEMWCAEMRRKKLPDKRGVLVLISFFFKFGFVFFVLPILISASLFSLHTSPYFDNSHPLCLCFSFLSLSLCITRCTLTFTSRTPPAYFVRLPYVIVSHPLCLCFSFLGICLCITRCTLTFTSCTLPAYFVHLPHVIVSHPLCLCFSFLGLCFMFISCTSHITHAPYYCCFFHFYPFFVIKFFLKKKRK